MQSLDPSTELSPQHFLQRYGVLPDDGDFETSMAQRSGHFEADETGTNHNTPLGSPSLSDDRSAVRQGSQAVDVRQSGAFDCQRPRLDVTIPYLCLWEGSGS